MWGGNHIWGSIPSGLTKLVNLIVLGLSDNQLTGAIPDCIGSLKTVTAAFFGHNKLTGNIPLSFGNLSMLSILALDQNALEGRIPSTLGNCKNLQTLYLGGNRLTGVVPAELFTADSSLLLVALEENQLKGVLPLEVGQLRNLVTLSVSSNELSGEIPESLGRCAGLEVLHMSGNSFEGSIPETFSALRSLEQLDLSDNNFSGPIPSYFSDFPLYLLNLSFNDFEGEVPTGGVFANDSALFLEGNHGLCGGIVQLQLPKCTLKEARPSNMNHRKLIMIISATCGAIATVSALLLIAYVKKKNGKNLTSAEAPLPQEQFLKMSYEMLLKATAGFLPANLIGMGSFGSVYKGVITISDATEVPIAVKVLDLQRRGSIKSFVAECAALTRIRHRNLVKIISACSSIDFKGNDFKALIYEFISNGSLDQWLYPGEGTSEQNRKFQEFGLLHRVNVAFDMASVLDYLHNGCVTAVVHCDIKPSNILLDDDMVAHLGDFGLSRVVTDMGDQTGSSSTFVKGTVGYAAPEYGLGSAISTEGDIYSFGIVLLELMIRKRPTDTMFDNGLSLHKLAEMALLDQDHLTDIVDATLVEAEIGPTNHWYHVARRVEVEYHKKMACIASILHIGVACSMESPNDRINIDEAVRRLKLVKDVQLGARAVSDLQIP
ncbi:putative LRR receptor-like serine/threonine-protein kinase [Drosera capensis]